MKLIVFVFVKHSLHVELQVMTPLANSFVISKQVLVLCLLAVLLLFVFSRFNIFFIPLRLLVSLPDVHVIQHNNYHFLLGLLPSLRSLIAYYNNLIHHVAKPVQPIDAAFVFSLLNISVLGHIMLTMRYPIILFYSLLSFVFNFLMSACLVIASATM